MIEIRHGHLPLSNTLERVPHTETLRYAGYHPTVLGGRLSVFSESATRLEVRVWSAQDPQWLEHILPMERGTDDIWSVESEFLIPGTVYSVHADGPTGPRHAFDPDIALVDPYARGIIRTANGERRNVIVDNTFDWEGVAKPRIPMRDTVIYEAHIKGLTAAHPDIPHALRGTYAGLAHPAMIAYLKDLGVTSVELLPIHIFASEMRLTKQGLHNYWGYNTLNFFTPHPYYASESNLAAGPSAVLAEFKGMVKILHEAGLEVILDVVYNHTSEGGYQGEPVSFRGLDNANYYRQTEAGEYIDTTGCSNTLNTSVPAVHRLIVDSLRFWADECGVDGFRFDLMASLGRNEIHHFDPEHPLLQEILSDPILSETKLISEPWDTGMGGWQVGKFPAGYHEWNDHFRDRVRQFWLRDIAETRAWSVAPQGVADLSAALSGSTAIYGEKRTPLASVNFVTAHDGFTLADLVSYDVKHNKANGESNRDGTDNNTSFNFGDEGITQNEVVTLHRRRAMRSLLGTLFVSAGVPMLTAGDETGRTQNGNNNAYCHDSALTWLNWDLAGWQRAHLDSTKRLIQIRRENPALRGVTAARPSVRRTAEGAIEESTIEPFVGLMDWYTADGLPMALDDWHSSLVRTVQYLVGTPAVEDVQNRVLVVIHGLETSQDVVFPARDDVRSYTLLWDSSHAAEPEHRVITPGETLTMGPTSLSIYRVD